MRTRRSPASAATELMTAVLTGDHAQLRSALLRASAEDLATTGPVSLYHAAAASNDAEAVRLLAAAGAPISAAERVAGSAGWEKLNLLSSMLSAKQHSALRHRSTALVLAARHGYAAVVSALLSAGAAPSRGALEAVSWSEELDQESAAAAVQALLAAGAPIPLDCLKYFAANQPRAAQLLVTHLHQLSLAGTFQMPTHPHKVAHVLGAAASTDSVPALEHFLLQLPGGRAPLVAYRLLDSAARHGSTQVVQLALQAASVGAAASGSAVARMLGPHVGSAAPGMLAAAADEAQAAVVQLILGAGHPATARNVTAAVEASGHCSWQAVSATLQALLANGVPPVLALPDRPLRLPSEPWSSTYTCPVLATLQQAVRLSNFYRKDMGPLLLLPLEQLLAAGCRPTVYHNVRVYRSLGGPVEALERFDAMQHDTALTVDRCTRWLALAIQHPQWLPEEHHRFPPAFRAAASALLLAAYRASSQRRQPGGADSTPCGRGGAHLLASLPHEVLLHIIGLAAYPLSAWVSPPPSS